jgi:hypothetical protein
VVDERQIEQTIRRADSQAQPIGGAAVIVRSRWIGADR